MWLSWRIGPLDDTAVQTEAAKYWTKPGERRLGTDPVSSIWIVDSRGAVELLWLESPIMMVRSRLVGKPYLIG